MKTLTAILFLIISLTGYGQTTGQYINTLPKDTFTEVSEQLWYNEAKWSYIDSSIYYNNPKIWLHWWDKYMRECGNDSVPEVRCYYNNPKIWLHWWDQYVQECYNDSVPEVRCYCYDIYNYKGKWYDQDCDREKLMKAYGLEWRVDTVWLHPHKAEFPEFMEWVGEKIEQ